MSFILDALKKSESDRQRQSGPSLFEVKVAPPRRTLPIWAVAIAALLAINVIVISWMLLRHPAAQEPTAASSTVSPRAAVNARPIVQDTAQDTVPARTLAPPSAAASAVQLTTNAAPPTATAAAMTPQPHPHAATPGRAPAAAPLVGAAEQSGAEETPGSDPGDTAPAVEPAASRASGASGAGDSLPLYQQVVSSAGLPDLHLDLHVFAERPRDRFVMINMHRLGEGDSLPNGVQVDEIRPDGVALSYHGTRFLLPRN